jgi:glycosyltransferase involved in cell wall biosynthesis
VIVNMPKQSEIRVAICICTFRRRALLRELLRGIAQQTFRKAPVPRIEVVVVDNDELASAEEICRSVSLPWPIRYVIEPHHGITYARNRAIATAGSVDFIAFIDDDEVPSAEWLDELLCTQARFAADVVSGPVLPRYSPEIGNWVKAGGFFGSRIIATGTARNTCATNNVLIETRVFHDVPGFDHAYAVSGAEDTNFFLRIVHAGYKIIWSQEATVFESVPADRGSVAWILRREYQTGNGWVFCEAEMNKTLSSRLIRFAKASGHIAIGSAFAIWRALLLDKAVVVHSLRRVSLGAGMLTALAGHRFLAYQDHRARRTTPEHAATERTLSLRPQ